MYSVDAQPHCKNVWVISTCFCLPELLTSIDDCNSDNHKWVETTQTFLQCTNAYPAVLCSSNQGLVAPPLTL